MRTLRLGYHGDDVRELQARLNVQLALEPPLEEQGAFNRATLEAVYALQASSVGPDGRPLNVDGVVGPLTWWALTTTIQPPPASFELVRHGPMRCKLGAATVDVLEEQIEQGAREIDGNNQGRFVERYLAPLHLTEGPWCAGLASFAVHIASSRLGCEAPFPYLGTARGILRALDHQGLTYDPDDVEPMGGDVVVWWRGTPTGWQGHIGTITNYEAGVIWTIEGNRGGYPAPVRQFSYVIEREKRLLGFARLSKE